MLSLNERTREKKTKRDRRAFALVRASKPHGLAHVHRGGEGEGGGGSLTLNAFSNHKCIFSPFLLSYLTASSDAFAACSSPTRGSSSPRMLELFFSCRSHHRLLSRPLPSLPRWLLHRSSSNSSNSNSSRTSSTGFAAKESVSGTRGGAAKDIGSRETSSSLSTAPAGAVQHQQQQQQQRQQQQQQGYQFECTDRGALLPKQPEASKLARLSASEPLISSVGASC
ncbi:hypothetical protein Esti_002211 [Eimeria stiedai]